MKWRSLSYRVKQVLVYCVTIMLTVGVCSAALVYTASQQVTEDNKAHLHLLTEQVLLNYTAETEAVAQQVINMASSTGMDSQAYAMRDLEPDAPGYYQATQTLVYGINRMINAQTGYDAVYLRLDQGTSFTNSFASDKFISSVSAMLQDEALADNAYGQAVWRRDADGEVYVARDLYNRSPLRHLGKLIVHVRRESMASLGSYNTSLRCALVFLDAEGHAVATSGEAQPGMEEAAERAAAANADELELGETYCVSIKRGQSWTAVGLMPESALRAVVEVTIRTGVFIALLGVALGALVVLASTHRMTRQINRLVASMDEVASGNMDLRVPVESDDEIGRMATHFNDMIGKTKELLERVVREKASKNEAEYQMLEYKYRSLQSQINPHFIYNAMETVNALAKIDGNEEICDVVQHISAFFRQNTGNMQKRFITVSREFDSLKQYAYIYRHIHGESLSTPFSCTPDAAYALLPTMILQPVLENALVHGVRSGSAEVDISARDEGERLLIQVRDNGEGMSPERVEQLLHGRRDEPETGRSSTGIGIRNVRDRLWLIYGEQAELRIASAPGEGTTVSIALPLCYQESELIRPEAALIAPAEEAETRAPSPASPDARREPPSEPR